MTWIRKVARIASVSIATLGLGGGLLATIRWAESRALATLMGSGAQASAIKLHWSQSAGCAEGILIPLTSMTDSHFSPPRLTAGRMWFTYDVASLWKKRLVVPRVLIDDALLDVRQCWPVCALPHVDQAHSATEPDASPPEAAVAEKWLAQLGGLLDSLEEDQFIGGTQVAVDMTMLDEQWRSEFAGVHERARRILSEARDIEQHLASMDNILRQEGQVVASCDRLEVLKATLVAMKSDLARTERTLRDQQSRVREALLIEKNALHEKGAAFRAPSADPLAAKTVELWVAECLRRPVRFSRLVGELIHQPYAVDEVGRGQNIRFIEQGAAEFSVQSAKISGEILADDSRWPFVATGSFQLSTALPDAGQRNSGERADWKMLVGGPAERLCLDGGSVDTRSGTSQVTLQSAAAGQVVARCELSPTDMRGTGCLQLREWLQRHAGSRSVEVVRAFHQNALLVELLEQSLTNLTNAPQAVEFQFSGPVAAPQLTVDAQGSRWLAEQLEQLASRRVAASYELAAENLDARIRRDLDSLNRSVAIARNEAFQYVNQQLEELRTVETGVQKRLQQRSGAHFARQPNDDLLK